jgi:hypothetical protein
MSLDDFRDEMQHRVVKYSLRSKEIREAVRFARQNEDANFYRVALDKIDAQKQFSHEQDGPSRMQCVLDFLGGTPRDISLTMIVVLILLAGWKFVDGRIAEQNVPGDLDIDRLAERMGFYVQNRKAQDAAPQPHDFAELERQVSDKIDRGITEADVDEVLTSKFSSVIEKARWDEVAAAKLGERLEQTDLEKVVADGLNKALEHPALKQMVIERVDQHVTAAGIKQRVIAEFDAALRETKLNERISTQIDARLAELDQQISNRMSQFNDDLTKQLQDTLANAGIEGQVNQRIEVQLAKLDRKLDEFDKKLLERAQQFQEQIASSLKVVLDDGQIEKQLSSRVERKIDDFERQLVNRVAAADQPPVTDGSDKE